MMNPSIKETVAALLGSLVAHAVIITCFGAFSISHPGKTQHIAVNLIFENSQVTARDQRGIINQSSRAGVHKQGRKDNPIDGNRQKPEKQALKTLGQPGEKEAMKQYLPDAKVVNSVEQNQTSAGVYPSAKGNRDSSEDLSQSDRGSQTESGPAGHSKVLDYRRASAEENNFYFIRETVMKNIEYPERARRMEWEGVVLLSFAVLESGIIKDIKVLKGSGYRTLDDYTREAVQKTTFKRKISHRLLVHLPIEYRLQKR